MANDSQLDDSGGGNRSVLNNAVRVLSGISVVLGEILVALEALAPTTIGVTTVAGLPTAAAAGQGARRLVTDANATTFASVVVGGGSNVVPVYSDAADWRIG
jgi:hypothetical protein